MQRSLVAQRLPDDLARGRGGHFVDEFDLTRVLCAPASRVVRAARDRVPWNASLVFTYSWISFVSAAFAAGSVNTFSNSVRVPR
jgi:hypothetical protein